MTRTWHDGLVGAGVVTEAAGVVFPKHELHLHGPGDLQALLQEMELFTPAAAYVFGGLTDVLWFDLSAELGHDLPLFFWESPRPLLAGLEIGDDTQWNHALWATYKMYWPLLCDFLLSVVFHDRQQGTACGFGMQQLLLSDPLSTSLLSSPVAPVLPVTAFGINGSDRRVAFTPLDARVSIPTVRRFAPADDMCKVAAALANADATDVAGIADVKGVHGER